MLEKLNDLELEFLRQIREIDQIDQLNDLRVKLLGVRRNNSDTQRPKEISLIQRAEVGRVANEIKERIESKLQQRSGELKCLALDERLRAETIDVTLPGIPFTRGGKHPLTQIREEIQDIFIGMGFTVAEGPEIELDYYNFEA